MQDVVDIIEAMVAALKVLEARNSEPERMFFPQLMPILDVRDLARDGQRLVRNREPADEAQRQTWQLVRVGMTRVEVAVHAFIAAQPDSSPQDDQVFVDQIVDSVVTMANALPQIRAIGQAPDKPTLLN